jgi:cytidylate kinase
MSYTALAISGDPCSGKTTLITKLASQLQWETLSIGGLFRTQFEKWKSVNPIRMTQERDFDWWWAHRVSNEDIRDINTRATLKLAQGNVILDSRYAPNNAKRLSNVALVFLAAPLDIRAERAQKRYGGLPLLGRGGVTDQLHQRAQEEYRRGKELYHLDYRDPSGYHLVLNSGLLTIDEEVSLVLTLLGRKS